MPSRDYEAELLRLCLQCDPPNCKALVRPLISGHPPTFPPKEAAARRRERMERLAKGMLIATGCRFRCSEMTDPSRRGRLVGVMCRTCLLLRADFLHFVSFRICAADNRLQPFRKFFPTGHPKRNGPWARNEMPSRNARGNRRRGRAGICAIPALKKSSGGPAWPAAKKPCARRDALRSCPHSGDRAAADGCPRALKPRALRTEFPHPFCGSGPADRGVDQGTRFYRSRPVRRGQHRYCRGTTVCDGPGRGICATPGFIRTDVGMPVADDRIDMCRSVIIWDGWSPLCPSMRRTSARILLALNRICRACVWRRKSLKPLFWTKTKVFRLYLETSGHVRTPATS